MLQKMFGTIPVNTNGIIPMEIPPKIRELYSPNELGVYNSIIKEKKTGRIVGHLQQTVFDQEINLMQTLSQFFDVANLGVSVINLGISICMLHKITKIEHKLESIEKKIDFLFEGKDKLRDSLLILNEIEKKFINLLKQNNPRGDSENLRHELLVIKANIFYHLKTEIYSDHPNIEFCINLLHSIGKCQKLTMLTYYICDELNAAEFYGQQELLEMKQLFADFIGMEDKFGEAVVFGVLGNSNYELKKHYQWIRARKNSDDDEIDVSLLNLNFKQYFFELFGQISITNSIRHNGVSGSEFLQEASCIKDEPARFVPSPKLLTEL